MLQQKNDVWLPNFLSLSPAYDIFHWLPDSIRSRKNWPTVADYNCFAQLQNEQGLTIRFVDAEACHSPIGYEPTIYLHGEVNTRKENWHDFFNMLIWQTFSLGKSALNALHYQQLQKKKFNTYSRTPFENFLTLFDENGVVVFSSDESLLQLIRDMSWKEFFWERRADLSNVRCLVFGHSLHEKMLNPYVGMVGHSVLRLVSPHFFHLNFESQLLEVNQFLYEWLFSLDESCSPRDLAPLPVLGFPGWYAAADREEFYNDINYFRITRRN